MNSYKENSAGYQDIARHFDGCDFKPPLESYTNVEAYIQKILDKSHRFEYWISKDLAGLVAVYCNDFESKKAFITSVSVQSKYVGRGIARQLLQQAIDHCRKLHFKTIELEVFKQNPGAIGLYQKMGFEAVTQQTDKMTMKHNLDEHENG